MNLGALSVNTVTSNVCVRVKRIEEQIHWAQPKTHVLRVAIRNIYSFKNGMEDRVTTVCSNYKSEHFLLNVLYDNIFLKTLLIIGIFSILYLYSSLSEVMLTKQWMKLMNKLIAWSRLKKHYQHLLARFDDDEKIFLIGRHILQLGSPIFPYYRIAKRTHTIEW